MSSDAAARRGLKFTHEQHTGCVRDPLKTKLLTEEQSLVIKCADRRCAKARNLRGHVFNVDSKTPHTPFLPHRAPYPFYISMRTLSYFQLLIILIATRSVGMLLEPAEMQPILPPDLDWRYGAYVQPDEYFVNLVPGYTIDEHFKTIQSDLSDHLTRRYDDPELDYDSFSYHIRTTNRAHLDLIRRDSQVQSIGVLVEYVMIYDGPQDVDSIEALGPIASPEPVSLDHSEL